MDVNDVIIAKRTLEVGILGMLRDFSKRTGCRVEDVRLNINHPVADFYEVSDVSVKISL